MRPSLALLLLVACGPQPAPEPPPGDACAAAERTLQRLNCPEGWVSPGPDRIPGTLDDRSFSEECRLLEADFPGLAQPGCIAEATSCEQAHSCSGE